jgi:hypothetical protein
MTSLEFLFQNLLECPKDKLIWYSYLDKAKEIHNQEIEISDEEIEKGAANLANPNVDKTDNWIEGAKWYKEQLKQKNEK